METVPLSPLTRTSGPCAEIEPIVTVANLMSFAILCVLSLFYDEERPARPHSWGGAGWWVSGPHGPPEGTSDALGGVLGFSHGLGRDLSEAARGKVRKAKHKGNNKTEAPSTQSCLEERGLCGVDNRRIKGRDHPNGDHRIRDKETP